MAQVYNEKLERQLYSHEKLCQGTRDLYIINCQLYDTHTHRDTLKWIYSSIKSNQMCEQIFHIQNKIILWINICTVT